MKKNSLLLALVVSICVLAKFNILAASAVITVTPIHIAAQPSTSWTSGADQVVADAIAGTLSTNTAVSDPGDYAVCNYRIYWWSLVYSTGTHMWEGVLNPPAPFDQEFGRNVWALVDVRSVSGEDDLSLSMLTVTTSSSDGNVLGSAVSFADKSYTPRAVAVRKDGSMITSGSSTQKGARILVLVKSPLFNVGGTQSGLDQVKNWVNANEVYTLGYEAQVIGDGATKSKASVSTAGSADVKPFGLSISPEGQLSIIGGEANRYYRVYSKTSLPGGTWKLAGVVNGADTIKVPMNGATMFFRAVAQ